MALEWWKPSGSSKRFERSLSPLDTLMARKKAFEANNFRTVSFETDADLVLCLSTLYVIESMECSSTWCVGSSCTTLLHCFVLYQKYSIIKHAVKASRLSSIMLMLGLNFMWSTLLSTAPVYNYSWCVSIGHARKQCVQPKSVKPKYNFEQWLRHPFYQVSF